MRTNLKDENQINSFKNYVLSFKCFRDKLSHIFSEYKRLAASELVRLAKTMEKIEEAMKIPRQNVGYEVIERNLFLA